MFISLIFLIIFWKGRFWEFEVNVRLLDVNLFREADMLHWEKKLVPTLS